jgi:hypothetical protein
LAFVYDNISYNDNKNLRVLLMSADVAQNFTRAAGKLVAFGGLGMTFAAVAAGSAASGAAIAFGLFTFALGWLADRSVKSEGPS